MQLIQDSRICKSEKSEALLVFDLSPHGSLSWPDLSWPQNKEQIRESASAQNSSCLACSPHLWAELGLGIVIESRTFVCSLLAVTLLLTISYHDKESSVSKAGQPKFYWREGNGNRKQFKGLNWKLEKRKTQEWQKGRSKLRIQW